MSSQCVNKLRRQKSINLFHGKMHRNSLRERYEKKRKERQDILGTGSLLEDKKNIVFIEGLLFSDFFYKIN